MLSKLCLQLLVGVAVISSSVYSAERVHDVESRIHSESERVHDVASRIHSESERVHDVASRIHSESERIHAERLHGRNHAVAVSAPGAQYGNISDAIDDYSIGGNDDSDDDGEVEVGSSAFFGNASVSRPSLSQHGAGGSRPLSPEYYEAKGKAK